MATIKGIFCLEGEWSSKPESRQSIRPILDLLANCPPYFTPYVHREVPTAATLKHYVARWSHRRLKNYPILYLAFHGQTGGIYIGDRRHRDSIVTLDVLERQLCGKCKGRVIYFGACSVLTHSRARLQKFLTETCALAICGYSSEVVWLPSTAMELLVLGAFQDHSMTIRGVNAVKKRINREAGNLAKKLRFIMEVRKTPCTNGDTNCAF